MCVYNMFASVVVVGHKCMDLAVYCVVIVPLAMVKANDDVTIPKEELGAVSMLSVRIMHACCWVGETESGRGELSRDDDVEPLFNFPSSNGTCDAGEDILLYNTWSPFTGRSCSSLLVVLRGLSILISLSSASSLVVADTLIPFSFGISPTMLFVTSVPSSYMLIMCADCACTIKSQGFVKSSLHTAHNSFVDVAADNDSADDDDDDDGDVVDIVVDGNGFFEFTKFS